MVKPIYGQSSVQGRSTLPLCAPDALHHNYTSLLILQTLINKQYTKLVADELVIKQEYSPDSVLIGAGEEGRCSFPAVTFTRFFWSGSWLGRSPDVGASYTRQRSFSLPL